LTNYSLINGPPTVGNYSLISSGGAQSDGDLRSVGSDSFLEAAEAVHQRSKSSDAQPETRPESQGFSDDSPMEWASIGPITNKAYVPLQESIYRMTKAQIGEGTDEDGEFVVIEKMAITAMGVRLAK
jgi:hypothetical protein